jgi:gamma-glutamyltranspeptidase/glutathione hydrolase
LSASFSRTQTVRKPGVTATSSGVVAAQHVLAAEAGAEVLAQGGDAVDAAVAVSFAIGVLEPWMSGPAGGGAMMLWRADEGSAKALHFGMRASAALDPGHYPLSGRQKASDLFTWDAVLDDRNVVGGSAVAVPGVVAGAAAAHERYGRMEWAELLQPAIGYAREGMQVDWYASLIIASAARDLARDPDAAVMFLDDGRWPKTANWTSLDEIRLDQSRMAETLELMARDGPDAFYRGEIGEALVRDVTDKGGFLTREDLAAYRAEWQTPLEIPYRHHRLWAVPRLTAGPALADAMTAWQHGFVPGDGADADCYVAIASALRSAYARRLADAGEGESPNAPSCTTHFSIVDRHGNMVAITQTLLSAFGARVVSPRTGLVLNNGIMWFDPVPGGPNSLGPGRRCLMNVCPVIGEAGRRRFALGASGGRKIMPAVGQVAAFLADFGMSIEEAVAAPRLDASGGSNVVVDERFAGDAVDALLSRWPTVKAKRLPFPYAFACPAGVMREGDVNSGASETFSPWGDAVAEDSPG